MTGNKIFEITQPWYKHDTPIKLGESPIYRESDSTLHWVDFVDQPCKLYVLPIDATTTDPLGPARVVEIINNEYISVIRFRKDKHGSYVCACSRGIGYLNEHTGEVQMVQELVTAEEHERGLGLNDGGVDPQGRFWVGGLDLKILQSRLAGSPAPDGGWIGRSKLWVFDGKECRAVLSGVICGNGLGWSPNGQSFYFNDSGKQSLMRYDFDGETSEISKPKVVIDGLNQGVLNDGMTIDGAGNLWIAFWEDSCVKLYTPDGDETRTVRVPAKCVTCVAFAGRHLTSLILTTARPLIGESPKSDQGGQLFRFETDVMGMPTNEFDG